MTQPIDFPPSAFGYVLEGEMLFELEGEPERVIRAGEAFWEQGGDVIHCQDGNNRKGVPSRFVVTMMCEPRPAHARPRRRGSAAPIGRT
ncbi:MULTISPECIES: hypothetical protein [Streptomyces]|uniref:hypothetical protein n=1 Tax=Streptomyces TaxID=1883 RepID=UPI0026CDA40B